MSLLNYVAQIVNESELNIPKSDLTNGPSSSVHTALQLVFGTAGGLAFLIIVVAGLKFITSQGDPQATNKARNTVIYAIIGLVVSAIAFSIVTFVLDNI